MYLAELERLSRDLSGKLTIIIDCGIPSAAWKLPGNRAERVSAFQDQEGGIESVLHELLERLGRYRDVPTTRMLLHRMTPGQKLRMSRIYAEYVELKREVLNPTPIEVIEPRLASPRSSLNPAHFDATFEGDD
jgi:hypothetical protein